MNRAHRPRRARRRRRHRPGVLAPSPCTRRSRCWSPSSASRCGSSASPACTGSCPSSRRSSPSTAGCSTSTPPAAGGGARRASAGSWWTPSPATASPTRCASSRRSAPPRPASARGWSRACTSALRGVLANETLPAVLSADRARIMGEIRQRVEADAQRPRHRGGGRPHPPRRPAGAEHPAHPPAHAVRARARGAGGSAREGAEQAQRIVAAADRERTVLLAEAQAKANALRGEGEQAAITHLRRGLPARPGILPVLAHHAGLARGLLRRRDPACC